MRRLIILPLTLALLNCGRQKTEKKHDIEKPSSLSSEGIATSTRSLIETPTPEELEVVSTKIPKVIWTFYDSLDRMPELFKVNIEALQRLNPDYVIRVVHLDEGKKDNLFSIIKQEFTEEQKTKLPEYYKDIDKDILFANIAKSFADNTPDPQTGLIDPLSDRGMPHKVLISDIARIILVSHLGGIWVDGSIIPLKPFDQILSQVNDHPYLEVHGFGLKHYTAAPRTRYNQSVVDTGFQAGLENWYFASKENSAFMMAWHNAFFKTLSQKTKNMFVKDTATFSNMRRKGYDATELFGWKQNYLYQHLSVHAALYHNPMLKHKMLVEDAGTDKGPFFIQFKYDAWDGQKMFKLFCEPDTQLKREIGNMPFIKLAGQQYRFFPRTIDEIRAVPLMQYIDEIRCGNI